MDGLELRQLREENRLQDLVVSSAKGLLAVHAMGGDLHRAAIELQRVIADFEYQMDFVRGGSFLEIKTTPLLGCKNKEFL